MRLLKTVDKLKALSDNKIMRIADCVEEASFKRDDYIIRQGEVGDSFYVIQDGQVKVTKNKVSIACCWIRLSFVHAAVVTFT